MRISNGISIEYHFVRICYIIFLSYPTYATVCRKFTFATFCTQLTRTRQAQAFKHIFFTISLFVIFFGHSKTAHEQIITKFFSNIVIISNSCGADEFFLKARKIGRIGKIIQKRCFHNFSTEIQNFKSFIFIYGQKSSYYKLICSTDVGLTALHFRICKRKFLFMVCTPLFLCCQWIAVFFFYQYCDALFLYVESISCPSTFTCHSYYIIMLPAITKKIVNFMFHW